MLIYLLATNQKVGSSNLSGCTIFIFGLHQDEGFRGIRPDAEVILGLRVFFDFDEWQESELRMLGVTLG